jgi:hypothetical protein
MMLKRIFPRLTGGYGYRYRVEINNLQEAAAYNFRIRAAGSDTWLGNKLTPYTSKYNFCTKSSWQTGASEMSRRVIKRMAWQLHTKLVYLDNSSAVVHIFSKEAGIFRRLFSLIRACFCSNFPLYFVSSHIAILPRETRELGKDN